MNRNIRSLMLAAAGFSSLLTIGCVSKTDANAMRPASAAASNRTGQPVQAFVSGGSATTAVQGPGIANDDFKRALESSLVQSGLFNGTGGGGYQLEAFITDIDQPVIGFSMRVNMDVSYTLRRGGATVWRKSIRSTYVAPVGEAFAGWVRLRKATEGAARENIAMLIRSLDEKRL